MGAVREIFLKKVVKKRMNEKHKFFLVNWLGKEKIMDRVRAYVQHHTHTQRERERERERDIIHAHTRTGGQRHTKTHKRIETYRHI